jgi:hypothetical protein
MIFTVGSKLAVEQLFQWLDKVLGLSRFSQSLTTLVFIVLSFFSLTLIFWFWNKSISKSNTNSVLAVNTQNQFSKMNRIREQLPRTLILLSFSLLAYRVLALLLSTERTASSGYVVSSVLATSTIIMAVLLNGEKNKEKLMVFLVVAFVITSTVLEVAVLNGVQLLEPTQDSVNIFTAGHWSFSYQNPIYDTLPTGPVLDAIFANVLGIRDVTNPLVWVVSGSAISLVTVLSIILFCRFAGFSTKVGLLTALFASSLPYLQYNLPSSNFSFMSITLFMALSAKSFSSRFNRSNTSLGFLFFAVAMLAHEMAILILVVPLAALIILFTKHPGTLLRWRLLAIIWFGSSFLLILNVYTRASQATVSWLNLFINGVFHRLTISTRVSSFTYLPTSVRLVYFLPFVFVGAFILCFLVNSAFRRNFQIGMNPRIHIFLGGLYGGTVALASLTAFTMFGSVPITRHIGVLASLCLGLGAAPIFSMISRNGSLGPSRTLSTAVKGLQSLLISLAILIIILSGLTPHKMPDQFSNTVSERGGVLDDYRLSEFLATYDAFESGDQGFCVLVNAPWITIGTLNLAVPVSIAKHDMTVGLQNPPKINFTVYDTGEGDRALFEGINDKSLIFNSQLYEVFVENDS